MESSVSEQYDEQESLQDVDAEVEETAGSGSAEGVPEDALVESVLEDAVAEETPEDELFEAVEVSDEDSDEDSDDETDVDTDVLDDDDQIVPPGEDSADAYEDLAEP